MKKNAKRERGRAKKTEIKRIQAMARRAGLVAHYREKKWHWQKPGQWENEFGHGTVEDLIEACVTRRMTS